MEIYMKSGKIAPKVIKLNGKTIINPTSEQYEAAGYTLFVPPVVPEHEPAKPTYEELVVRFIRERYSIDAELAILRQRDSKPEEFREYNDYCEDCKRRAKEVL